MLFGGIVALGFCRADHMGQCLAHFIMGSAFIGYGIVLTIALLVGQYWIRRHGRSQEFYDSAVIAVWGCVNTFTEHRWGGPWAHNDLQHTSMGIVWWCAGLVGMWLSRTRDGRPKRNVIPGIVILLTGYAMSAHPQALMLSTMVHSFFGYTLMAAGLTRIIEVSFVLRDRSSVSVDGNDPNSFQYVPVFVSFFRFASYILLEVERMRVVGRAKNASCWKRNRYANDETQKQLLYASGFLFMGATEEQMALLAAHHVTHVSYILILYSFAFMTFLFVNVLLHVYAVHVFPVAASGALPGAGAGAGAGAGVAGVNGRAKGGHGVDDPEAGLPLQNGHANGANGHAFGGINNGGINTGIHTGSRGGGNEFLSDKERRQARDAQEFELDALISGSESDEDEVKAHRNGEGSSSGGSERGRLRL